jgi:ethanolamine ammonia-lyase small subunit
VASEAPDRRAYLLRPDLGRRLRAADAQRLPAAPGAFVFVVADGLCATGVSDHAPALLRAAASRGRESLVIVNNKAEGSAPLSIETLARQSVDDPAA